MHQCEEGSHHSIFVQTLSKQLVLFLTYFLDHLYQFGSASFAVHWRCWLESRQTYGLVKALEDARGHVF